LSTERLSEGAVHLVTLIVVRFPYRSYP
jgi:hypothetical protein